MTVPIEISIASCVIGDRTSTKLLVYYHEVNDVIDIVHLLHGARDRDRVLGSE